MYHSRQISFSVPVSSCFGSGAGWMLDSLAFQQIAHLSISNPVGQDLLCNISGMKTSRRENTNRKRCLADQVDRPHGFFARKSNGPLHCSHRQQIRGLSGTAVTNLKSAPSVTKLIFLHPMARLNCLTGFNSIRGASMQLLGDDITLHK